MRRRYTYNTKLTQIHPPAICNIRIFADPKKIYENKTGEEKLAQKALRGEELAQTKLT